MHSQDVLHRNLKPENMFIARVHDPKKREKDYKGDMIGKLSDFGFARLMKSTHTRLTTAAGPPLYMSP